MPHTAASDLGLYCLPRFQKWDTRLIKGNNIFACDFSFRSGSLCIPGFP